MDETQEQIEEHNTRELWRDAARCLLVVVEELENAQGVFDDLRSPHLGDRLTLIMEDVNEIRLLAKGRARA